MTNPRCVIDTKVLISAGLKAEGTPGRVLMWVARHGCLLASDETLGEFVTRFIPRAKFDRYATPEQRASFAATVIAAATRVRVTSRLSVCADPDDDRFVELAVDGRADCLVTGNTKDFPPSHAGIPVLTPSQFVRAYIDP